MNSYIDKNIMSMSPSLRAMANENRLQILHWLGDPENHFPTQVDGDLVTDGVCVGSITEKIGLRQPTVTSHMKVLQDAGLVSSKKIKNWVFYKLDKPKTESSLKVLSGLLISKE
jgi:DNA-binding transcriptional ArsR family regulator